MINPKFGDIGTAIDITIVEEINGVSTTVDISTAENMIVKFMRPDQTGFSRIGTFKTDGTDGIIRYITIANDLDQVGTWKVSAEIEMGGNTWNTDIEKMKVGAILSGE